MRQRILAFAALCLIALPAPRVQAEGEAAGDFDYFVMSLGWSSNWWVISEPVATLFMTGILASW